jgi:hypothetical protein
VHPVLVDYQHAWLSIYVSSAPESAEAVLQDVSARVATFIGPWRNALAYLNDQMNPLELLQRGFGLFAHAPESVAHLICVVLKLAGVSYTTLPSRHPREPAQALIAGPNFVVASGFRREQSQR